jgi:hypothetical protein
VPAVTSLEALNHAADSFELTGITLDIEPSAREAAQRSLEHSGLLLLGEVHGVRENPLVIRALLQAFGVNQLALEWPAELTSLIDAYIQGAALKDHPALWLGDGRITAGHLAVVRDRAKAGPFGLILFDQLMRWTSTWSERDEAMAGPILAGCEASGTKLVVAGNAHTPTRPTALGVPLGARLAAERPGVREIRIRYGAGHFYNGEPRRFPPDPRVRRGPLRLGLRRGNLLIDLPGPSEAIVPHRLAGRYRRQTARLLAGRRPRP